MQTEKMERFGSEKISERIEELYKVRNMSEKDWIEKFGSSTLRRGFRFGSAYKDLYLHERIPFEFGTNFRMLSRSRIIFGDAYIEGDCPPITEAQWLADRYMSYNPFAEDYFEYKHIRITNKDHQDQIEEQGQGLILRQTSADFIPNGQIVFCIITQFDEKTQSWLSAEAP